MSSTVAPSVGWTPARVKRSRMFAVLLVVCALAAMWATFQPWFAWSTAGVPSCDKPTVATALTVQTQAGSRVDGIVAGGCIDGVAIAAQSVSPVGTAAGVASVQSHLQLRTETKAPAAMLGLPRTVTLLIACLTVAVFGLLARNGLLVGLASAAMFFPHRDLTDLRGMFLSGNAGSLTVTQVGSDLYSWALLAGWALAITATVFVVQANTAQRAHVRAQAAAVGKEPPADVFDHVAGFVGKKVAKVLDETARARTREEAH